MAGRGPGGPERERREETDTLVYRDQAGRVADFHALRHTFLTNLARAGVHPKVAQALARHSTVTLTLDRYTHTVLGEQSAAVALLPDLGQAPLQRNVATGTDGAKTASRDSALCSARNHADERHSMRPSAVKGDAHASSGDAPNVREHRDLPTKESGRGGIRTPGAVAHPAVFKTAALDHSATRPGLPF